MFYPEAGYYTGSIYINYAVCVVVMTIALFVLRGIPERLELLFFSTLAALAALAFFHHSRSLWITFDFWMNPWKPVGNAGSKGAWSD